MQDDFKPDPRKLAALQAEMRKADRLLRRLYGAQERRTAKGKAA